MYKLALIGRDIGYTRSPLVHKAIARAAGYEVRFDVFDVKYDELDAAVSQLMSGCDGFFVTRPYKQSVNKIITGKDGPINVVRCRDGAAFDTDGVGFILSLDNGFPGWRERVNGVLIMGAGGAAHSVTGALTSIGKKVYVLDRTTMNAARLVAMHRDCSLYTNQPVELAVNCTSVGRGGEDILKTLCVLPEFEYAFDLVYADGGTRFLQRAAASGAKTSDGADMLVYQAIEGVKLITEQRPDTQGVFDKAKKILTEDRL